MTQQFANNIQLVLASSSTARKVVLEKLQVPFDTFSPNIDESQHSGEEPRNLVQRLAVEKARAAADTYPSHLVIGSDQIAIIGNQVLGKPRNREHAISQLCVASGKEVELLTGLALLNTATGSLQKDVQSYRVVFRTLNRPVIERYIDKDQPYDCGGSLRSEGLGILLLREFKGTDPNTLIGLPLIRLIDMLANENYRIL